MIPGTRRLTEDELEALSFSRGMEDSLGEAFMSTCVHEEVSAIIQAINEPDGD